MEHFKIKLCYENALQLSQTSAARCGSWSQSLCCPCWRCSSRTPSWWCSWRPPWTLDWSSHRLWDSELSWSILQFNYYFRIRLYHGGPWCNDAISLSYWAIQDTYRTGCSNLIFSQSIFLTNKNKSTSITEKIGDIKITKLFFVIILFLSYSMRQECSKFSDLSTYFFSLYNTVYGSLVKTLTKWNINNPSILKPLLYYCFHSIPTIANP